MKAYSEDLRRKIIEALNGSLKGRGLRCAPSGGFRVELIVISTGLIYKTTTCETAQEAVDSQPFVSVLVSPTPSEKVNVEIMMRSWIIRRMDVGIRGAEEAVIALVSGQARG
jgi:hypothetical protein